MLSNVVVSSIALPWAMRRLPFQVALQPYSSKHFLSTNKPLATYYKTLSKLQQTPQQPTTKYQIQAIFN